MVRETRISVDQLVYPMFLRDGEGVREEIGSMPGQFRVSVDRLAEELQQVRELGIPAVMLFGIPGEHQKDAVGTPAFAEEGVICRGLQEAKQEVPDLLLIADVCLCEYTDHGHCGLISQTPGEAPGVDNDKTLEVLARTALAYAGAGADVIAPSDMMDGRVAAIRQSLDAAELYKIPILSYAAKYASAYYGPFREAAGSAPQFGDRKSYQMDPANAREALKEVRLDLEEGADMVMVKPALPYLDVITRVREMTTVPVAAYQVSGEYSALCAAFDRGWLQKDATVRETLLAIRRAGADFILSYFAKDVAKMIREGNWE
jgi:porphobilinogen synthase